MSYFCNVCDKTINLKSKNKHFKSLYHRDYEKLTQINHTIQYPNLIDVAKLYNDYITNHNKNFEA